MSLETDTAEKIGKILAHVENHTVMFKEVNRRFDMLPCDKNSIVIQKCTECLDEKSKNKQTINNTVIKYTGQALYTILVSSVTYIAAKTIGIIK